MAISIATDWRKPTWCDIIWCLGCK